MTATEVRPVSVQAETHSWWTPYRIAIAVIAVAALAIRLYYVWVTRRDVVLGGDGRFYHEASKLLADGHGFITPQFFERDGTIHQAADHPPAFTMFLAGVTKLGLNTPMEHITATSLLGVGTVPAVAWATRMMAGRLAAVFAALFVALNPSIWHLDAFNLSEGLTIIFLALSIGFMYRYWHDPSLANAFASGLFVGLATMTRAEVATLTLLAVAPLVLLAKVPWRDRFAHAAVSAAAFLSLVTPWIAFNLSRFEEPLYMSVGLEFAMAQGTCSLAEHGDFVFPDGRQIEYGTYYGEYIGYWNLLCMGLPLEQQGLVDADQGVVIRALREFGMENIRRDPGQLPLVMAARVGRVLGVFRPMQATELENFIEQRERWLADSAMLSWYVLAGLSVGGAWILHRRGVTLIPVVALVAGNIVSVALTIGNLRYRVPLDMLVCMLGGVAAAGIAMGVKKAVDSGRAEAEAEPL